MAPATTSVPSLPSPCPKSPREYPDLYGKRREMAKVQMLEREIGFLEVGLKSAIVVLCSSPPPPPPILLNAEFRFLSFLLC
jgi:hypothetical protein